MSNSRLLLSGNNAITPPELLYVAHSIYEKDWTSVPHTHGFSELMYIEDGEGLFLANNIETKIQKGDCIVISPGCMHTERSSTSKRLGYYVLGIANLKLTEEECEIINSSRNSDRIYSIMRTIYKEMLIKDAGFDLMVESLLLELSVILMRGKSSMFLLQKTDNILNHSFKARSFIDEHYGEEITLEDIADHVSLSKFHLSREFKKDIGLSPMSYLAERRILEAKNLLVRTDYSIADIASSVGVSSSSYFSQSFRHLTGMTPQEFRSFSKIQERAKQESFINENLKDFRTTK
ncbi:MAG: AraC family transcriptional regulator [Spirochaetales bacterium]|jgi:AraC-like DNA-binding protein/mannose-6-phosphate isomerase-like protein (cupin superfamily)|nr:AraC family transcriptional regulator [Spirochaetales bacterium]